MKWLLFVNQVDEFMDNLGFESPAFNLTDVDSMVRLKLFINKAYNDILAYWSPNPQKFLRNRAASYHQKLKISKRQASQLVKIKEFENELNFIL